MAGTRQNNTMQEGLMKLLTELASLKVAPDADMQFLTNLEMQLIDTIKRPQQEALARFAQAGGVLPGGGPAAGPMPGAGPMMGPGPGQPTPMGPGAAGLRNGGRVPPVDELRRLIASSKVA